MPEETPSNPEPLVKAPFRLVVFWKEDARIKNTFIQYKEVQVADGDAYEFYPLVLSKRLEELVLKWKSISTLPEAIETRQKALENAQKLFAEALEASDNPHCETFVTQTTLNFLTTVDLLFNVIYFADELPLFFDQATVARTQQTGTLYVWLDPYLGGLTKRQHRALDTEEAQWPAKEEVYCYFKKKTDPTVSPQQLANIWRTNASRVVEIDEECRTKLWEWLKGQRFSEEEIRALILP